MAWQTPKTDWKINPVDESGRYNGDWFNWQDYERIRENIEYLAVQGEVTEQLYRMWTIDEIAIAYPEYTGYTEGAVVTDQMRYASPVMVELQINPIERNLDVLANEIYRPTDYPKTKTWSANGRTPMFSDINRWEACTKIIYTALNDMTFVGKFVPFELHGGAINGV